MTTIFKVGTGRHPRGGHYTWILATIWTTAIATSLIWNIIQVKGKILEIAYVQARSALEKDILYRRWNARHGGVYVPVSEMTPPNPYLSHIPERDIRTPSGKSFTLMNHAYMTQQVYELQEQEYGFRGHLTSLKPVRSLNAPDPWETKALEAFERSQTEVRSVEKIGDKEYMRLMHPFVTEEICIKCHAVQGYKVGEIRGGISVSIPMEHYWAIMYGQIRSLAMGHVLIGLIGLGAILLRTYHLRRFESERQRMEEVLKESERRYRSLFENIPIGLYRTTPVGEIVDINPALVQMLGHANTKSLRAIRSDETYVNPEDRAKWLDLVNREGTVRNFEKRLRRQDGKAIWVEETTQAVRDENGQTLCYEGSFQDITERKRLWEEREKLIGDLQEALKKVKTLSGLLPICSSCKKIRDDKGYWNQIESYISTRSEAEFSHGMCPECMKKLYPDLTD